MAGVSYAGSQPTEYLFIDGGCLRAATIALAERYTGRRDGARIAFEHLRRHFTKVFYYDAVPAQEHGEELEVWIERIKPQTDEFAKIRSLPGFHVQLGDLRGRPGNQRQKRVDVQIAVDMLLHTFRKNMDRCTMLAGDIDFQPLIEALIREGMFVDLWHPPRAASALLDAADGATPLTTAHLGAALQRSDGSALMARSTTDIRPRAPADLRHAWGDGTFAYELRRVHNGVWMLERFEPAASALSLQIMHASLRCVVETARDTIGIEPDSSLTELVGREQ